MTAGRGAEISVAFYMESIFEDISPKTQFLIPWLITFSFFNC